MIPTVRKFFSWQPGRRGGNYEKMLLIEANWPLPWGLTLVRYEKQQGITWHTDPIHPQVEHHRINFTLKSNGGFALVKDGRHSYQRGWVYRFRPDVQEHMVVAPNLGRRYVLSLGWIRKKK